MPIWCGSRGGCRRRRRSGLAGSKSFGAIERIAGIRVPVAIESVAQVLIAGRSTFQMTYEYETINGLRVGTPRPRPLPTSAR